MESSKSEKCIYRIASVLFVSAGAVLLTLYFKYNNNTDNSGSN